ncbi:uncharacterized protein LOC113207069 [Frankliniella occidentalis]|uniref:Uncharacterized protein LOC113207069 n=1 Tax=Frankliniella occidentalis TaxID=133901 RepID=A0A9C6TSY5_FRAOC|nr:uncharacterized protein LOC113207069 [Frankliniella occidentalis]
MKFSVQHAVLSTLSVFAVWSCMARANEMCRQEIVMGCAQPFSLLTDNKEMAMFRSRADLDRICPKLTEGVLCIDRFTRLCMNQQQRAHFHQLYHGTSEVIHDLCQDGEYREEFLRHAPCMSEVRSDHEVCSDKYQDRMARMEQKTKLRTARHSQHHHNHQHHYRHHHNHTATEEDLERQEHEDDLRTLCCSFQDYLRCSQSVVEDKCGEETARFAHSFMDRMASSLVQSHCTAYPPDSALCNDFASPAARPLSARWQHLLPVVVAVLGLVSSSASSSWSLWR